MISIKEGSLPHWDEQFRFTAYLAKDHNDAQSLEPHSRDTTAPYGPNQLLKQRRLGNLSVDDAFIIISEALKDSQAYHILDPNGRKWRVRMPYARYLKKGDPIRNLTTGETYTIGEVIDERYRDVLLTGNTSPLSTDKLRLHTDNEISLTHGFPRSFVNSEKIDTSSDQALQHSAFNDTITFLVRRSQPAGLDKQPFSSNSKVLSPRYRKTLTDPEDPNISVNVEGYDFHSIVAFDCWSRDNTRAADLLSYFEDFMFRSRWIFELYGLCRIYYWRRDEDQEVFRWRADITKRTVEYMIASERLFYSSSQRIRDLQVNVYTQRRDIAEPDNVLSDDTLYWPEPSVDTLFTVQYIGT